MAPRGAGEAARMGAAADDRHQGDHDPAERVSWLRLAWRIGKRFDSQQMFHHSAAMTYYTMLALFPALLVGIAMLGLFGEQRTVTEITDYLARQGAPSAVIEPIAALLRSTVRSRSGPATLTLVLSVLLSLFGASGAFAAARRALNVAFGVQETRAFVGRKAGDVGATLVLIVLGVSILVLLFLGGGVADQVFGVLGLGPDAAAVWQVARWPVALAVTLLAYAFIYAFAPDI